MAKRFGFGKKEKLKSRKQIEGLFAGGKSFAVFPLRVTYQWSISGEDPGLKVGVTASKRHFKKAVDRNRLKRRLREAYRLQKEPLLETLNAQGISGIAFFMYTDKTMGSFEVIKTAMQKCLKQLAQKAVKNETLP